MIHVVDLDGAREGHRINHATISAMCRAVSVPVEVSGGLRTMSDIEAAVEGGASRVQIGSAAVSKSELVADAVAAFADVVVVSIDARDGRVMTNGWKLRSERTVHEFSAEMVGLGVRRLMFTDIARDGAMKGPNVPAYRELVKNVPVPVVASGGVTSAQHLVALADAGCEGAVVGRALYEGTLDLADAIEAASQC